MLGVLGLIIELLLMGAFVVGALVAILYVFGFIGVGVASVGSLIADEAKGKEQSDNSNKKTDPLSEHNQEQLRKIKERNKRGEENGDEKKDVDIIQDNHNKYDYKIGDTINHSIYGKGVVEEIENDRLIIIRFNGVLRRLDMHELSKYLK